MATPPTVLTASGGSTKQQRRTSQKAGHSRSYPRGVGLDFRKLAGLTLFSYIDHHGTFTFESAWTKLRREFPEQLQPANKMSMDDSRAQWTTYSNLQQWFDDAKNCLIGSGLLIDAEVRDVNGVLLSELDFRSDDV